MPFKRATTKTKRQCTLQHLALPFRSFYTKQVAKAMFSEENRRKSPHLSEYLDVSMSVLSNKDIKQTDRAVIINADDGQAHLDKIKNPVMSLKGNIDYVGTPKNVDSMTIVQGAHSSPLEQEEEVLQFILELLKK